mgnify:CR=1 FL=1
MSLNQEIQLIKLNLYSNRELGKIEKAMNNGDQRYVADKLNKLLKKNLSFLGSLKSTDSMGYTNIVYYNFEIFKKISIIEEKIIITGELEEYVKQKTDKLKILKDYMNKGKNVIDLIDIIKNTSSKIQLQDWKNKGNSLNNIDDLINFIKAKKTKDNLVSLSKEYTRIKNMLMTNMFTGIVKKNDKMATLSEFDFTNIIQTSQFTYQILEAGINILNARIKKINYNKISADYRNPEKNISAIDYNKAREEFKTSRDKKKNAEEKFKNLEIMKIINQYIIPLILKLGSIILGVSLYIENPNILYIWIILLPIVYILVKNFLKKIFFEYGNEFSNIKKNLNKITLENKASYSNIIYLKEVHEETIKMTDTLSTEDTATKMNNNDDTYKQELELSVVSNENNDMESIMKNDANNTDIHEIKPLIPDNKMQTQNTAVKETELIVY